MIYYIILFLHLIFGKIKLPSKIIYLISFLTLFFIMAYRDFNVGTDVNQYFNDFEIYKSSGLVFSVEPFWYYLNKIVIILGGDFRDVLILSSLVILIPLYFLVDRWSYYPILSIFLYIGLYFFSNSFNAVRQSISIVYGACGVLLFLENKSIKNYKSFILLLISILFHYSSIIFLLSILIIKLLKKSKFNMILIVLLSFFFGLFFSDLFLIISQKITGYKIELYNILGNMAVGVIINILYIFISKIIKNKNDLYYLFTFYIILANILIRIPFGYRLILGLGLLQIIFFPNLLKNNKLDKSSEIILYLIFIVYSIYTLTFYLSINFSDVLPYNNVLF